LEECNQIATRGQEMSHAERRKEGHGKNGRRKTFGNTKIDVGLVTDKPHKVEMFKMKGVGGQNSSSSSSRSPKSSSKFVSEIKPCQQQFRENASVSTV